MEVSVVQAAQEDSAFRLRQRMKKASIVLDTGFDLPESNEFQTVGEA